VEALRLLFQEDLVARSPFASPPGGVWDRQGHVVDVDGTKQAARQRALPQTTDLPAPHRRFDLVAAPGYLGRKGGEIVRTRTTVLQAYTHQWLASFGNAGNGDYRGELLRVREVISTYATRLALPLSHVLVRLDGLYGNAAPLADLLAPGGPGVIVRGKDYHLLDLPDVRARLQLPPDQQTRHPESSIGLFEETTLCVLVRSSDQTSSQEASTEPPSWTLSIRRFGPDDQLAEQLIHHLMAWEQAGRPSAIACRIRAYSQEVPSVAEPHAIVVTKRWNRLVLDWSS